MINLCFFIGTFRRGGAENLVSQIIRNLDRKKYNVFLLAFTKKGDLFQEYKKLDVKIEIIPKKLLSIIKFVHFFKKNKIHCLHINLVGTFFYAITSARLAKINNIIIHWHNPYSYHNNNFKYLRYLYSYCRKWFLMRFSSRLCHKIIAISKAVKDTNCTRFGINPKKVSVIYNAIDLSLIPDRLKGYNKDKLTIGSIGKISPQKGFDILIYAMKIVIEKFPNSQLEIIGAINIKGNKKYSQKLLDLVNRLNLNDSVHFLDAMEYKKVYENLFTWSVFVLSSRWEGFGLVLIEAMASSVPVIGNSIDAIPEIIDDEKTGLLFNKDNPDDLANKIIRIIEEKEFSKELTKNAKKCVNDKFTIDKMITQLDKIYLSNYKGKI